MASEIQRRQPVKQTLGEDSFTSPFLSLQTRPLPCFLCLPSPGCPHRFHSVPGVRQCWCRSLGLVHGGFFLLLLLPHSAPTWAPPRATGPSRVCLPHCGHLQRLQSSQGCPCSGVESLLPGVHLQPRPQQCPLPHASRCVFFSVLSHASSRASRCAFCHRQHPPFLNKWEQRHCVLI